MSTHAAFATLGIAVGSQPTEITRAFRVLSRESHPDTGGDPHRFTAVVAAYRALQRAGLVHSQPAGHDTDDSGQPSSVGPVGHRQDQRVETYYRRFLQSLHRVSGEPDRPAPAVRISTGGSNTAPADRFAEILDRELLRVS